MEETPLRDQPSLHDELVSALRNMIVAGDLGAGDWIAEPALWRHLGVSRTPLREALKVLAFDGWVELVPNRGAAVTRITPEEVAALFELLEGLEQFVGELAAERASPQDIAEIGALHGVLEANYEAGDAHAYFTTNQAIHRRLVGTARNAALATTHRNLSQKVLRARAMANLLTGRQDASFAEHTAILAALERRDGVRLGSLLRAHVHDAGQAVLDALAKRERPARRARPARQLDA